MLNQEEKKSIFKSVILQITEKHRDKYYKHFKQILDAIGWGTTNFYYKGELFSIHLFKPYKVSSHTFLPEHLHKQGDELMIIYNDLKTLTDKVKAGVSYILRYCKTSEDIRTIFPSSLDFSFLAFIDLMDIESNKKLTIKKSEIKKIKESEMYMYITEQIVINMLLKGT